MANISTYFDYFLCFSSLIFTNKQKDNPLYKDQ